MKKRRIFVLGSLNMDVVIHAPYLPERGETLRGEGLLVSGGGKGANQAVAAARFGAEVHMLGAVGDDAFGPALVEGLKGYGVTVGGVRKVPGSSGVAVIVVVDGDNRIILEGGANRKQDDGFIRRYLEVNAERGDILICQLEIPIPSVLAAFACAEKIGMFTVLNPAPAAELPQEIYACTRLVIPNESETRLLTGIDPMGGKGCRAAHDWFRRQGVESLIVTLGSRGSVLEDANGQAFLPAYRVEAVDTTAAGDTFIGVLAAGLAEGMPLREAAENATKASAIAVSRPGAQQSVPSREEVEAFRGERRA